MAPTVPTVAYVGYKDGHKAIVAVSLIKNYAPSSLTDLQKDKDAYWRSRGSEDEGFYPADVLELGVTQTDLVKRLAKRRIPVPDSIFEDGVSATEVMKKAVSAKDAAAKVRAANKKKMQRLKQHSTSSSSDDDSVVPRAVLLDEQRKSSVLKRKLTTLRQEYHELQVRYNSLQDRHGKLEYVLLHKLGVSANFRETQAVLPGESDGGDNGSSTAGCSSGFHGSLDLVSDSTDLPQLPQNKSDGAHLPPHPPCSATPPAPTTEMSLQGIEPTKTSPASSSALHDAEDDMGSASTSAASTSAASTSTASTCAASTCAASTSGASAFAASTSAASTSAASAFAASTSAASTSAASTSAASTSQTPGILARVGDQVHLGNNVFVSAARWEWLLSRKKDSLFVKELTKTVWGVANLRDRSVTGAPCRRFLNTKDLGTVPKKRALTPRKLHAVGSAFDHFIGRAENDVPPKTRRSKMNRLIAEMLKDLK